VPNHVMTAGSIIKGGSNESLEVRVQTKAFSFIDWFTDQFDLNVPAVLNAVRLEIPPTSLRLSTQQNNESHCMPKITNLI
jgi:hypothetical protein